MKTQKNWNELNKDAYDRVARIYAGPEPSEDDPKMRLKCRRLFTDALSGKEVLEVGCGPGVDSSFLQQAGLDVTASDFSEQFLSIVQERYPSLKTHKMDMISPNLPLKSFDGLYSFASFIHLPRKNAPNVLSGFRKLLREPGVMFMSLIKSSKFAEYIIEDWAGQPNNPLLFTCYDPVEIERLLLDAGFNKIEVHEIESDRYKNLPRLVERGVTNYQILAFT